MVDKPWKDKILSKGQIRQILESYRCERVKDLTTVSEMWRAPEGTYFSISYDQIDGESLQKIIDQIEEWVGMAGNRRD